LFRSGDMIIQKRIAKYQKNRKTWRAINRKYMHYIIKIARWQLDCYEKQLTWFL